MTDLLNRLETARVVGVLRSTSEEMALELARAAIDAGLPAIEITYTTPGATDLITVLKQDFPSTLVGAGTILDEHHLRESAKAGADFAVSPHMDRHLVLTARSLELPFVPGAATTSEVATGLALDCSLLKIFPAARLGGPAYLRDLRGPFPELEALVTGGVSVENATDYLQAGAKVVGLGSIFGATAEETAAATHSLLKRLAG